MTPSQEYWLPALSHIRSIMTDHAIPAFIPIACYGTGVYAILVCHQCEPQLMTASRNI
jgi:hypothetical protein